MALRFIEGFESRIHSDYWSRIYASYAGLTGSTSTTTGRRGYGTGIEGNNMQFETRALTTGLQNTWIVQFAIRKNDLDAMSGNYGTFLFRNATGAGGDQFEVRWVEAAAPNAGAFQFELRRGTTVLATSRVFTPGNSVRAWWVIQLKVTIRTGTNGSYEMKAWDWQGNVETVFAATSSVNTAHAGTDGADRLFFRTTGGGVAEFALDDIVVMDSTGSVNNNFTSVPVLVMGSLLPNVDVVGEADWIPSTGTDHFALLQDTNNSPLGTGEVTSDVVGDVDLYGFSQAQLDLLPTGSPPSVLGIMVDVEALMKNSGSRTIRVRFKDSTNQADDTTDLIYSDTAKVSRYSVLEQNPTGTPAAWTAAVLKTIELGPKLTA